MMTPEHQALLLAYFVQEILNQFGKPGGELVSKAIRAYGEQRGRRMAEQASRDNRKNDLTGFLLYGEFDWDDTGNKFKIAHRKPFFEIHATKCFWHEIWVKNNMAEVGNFYCKDIDRAIMRGFNPGVNFEVTGNMSSGDECCSFSYRGWQMKFIDLATYILLKKKIKKKAVKSWGFHCADVFTVFSRVLEQEAGGADPVVGRVISRFSERFGKPAADELVRLVSMAP